MDAMDGIRSRERVEGPRGRSWLALVVVLLAAGCKPDDVPPASVGELSTAEFLAHLKLGGLVEDGEKRWALLLMAVPGRPAEHLKLMAGQRLGDLEVLAIDPAARTVEVRVGEREESLSLATHGLKPEDSYAWLQRLTPEEHARRHNSPARQQFVGDHAQAQEQRQREEIAREIEDRALLLEPSPDDRALESKGR